MLKYLIPALIIILGLIYFVEAADTGATIAGTGASDDSIGTSAWSNPTRVTASDDSHATAAGASNATPTHSTLFYNGDAYGDDQLVAFGNPITTGASDATANLGGATETWGATLTEAIVENAGFGYALACVLNPGSTQSHYLAATNFGFDLPTGATIDGIEVHVEGFISTATCRVDAISMTVYYTEAAAAVAATGAIRTGSVQVRTGSVNIR